LNVNNGRINPINVGFTPLPYCFLPLHLKNSNQRRLIMINQVNNLSQEGEVKKAGRKEWIGLAVIALPCLLYSMDLTVLNLAVPQLTADLKPTSSELLWIVDIYGFLIAGLLITMGTIGDRIGRRRLLLYGAGAFGLASVVAAFSTSAEMLIVARAILGIAGATLAPSTLSLIRNMFLDSTQRTLAIGVWVASYSAGGAIGPLIGGVMLEHYWWGSVFLIAVPVMVILLILAPILLPEYKDPTAGALDFVSVLLSLTSILSVIYGLKKTAEQGITATPLLLILVGLILGWMFLKRQKKLKDPMIDLRLFASPAFSSADHLYTYNIHRIWGIHFYLSIPTADFKALTARSRTLVFTLFCGVHYWLNDSTIAGYKVYSSKSNYLRVDLRRDWIWSHDSGVC
jgi:MFS transporter, DHA2 family, multidrug resistance protein